MSKTNIIRAWKDEAYRLTLSAAERALVPANPAGAIELDDAQLDLVSAGNTTPGTLYVCCTGNAACDPTKTK
jgi:mersacidin/lichenicidin family type 2 lantibiotic